MERRSANFVSMLERNVFGHPGSPYLPLFELAGIELGDVRNQVERSGLEGTLRSLRRAGVYVTFEEVKGRTPIIREGRELAPRGSFANPSIIPLHRSETGGSTGTATAVPSALDFHASAGAYQLLAWESRGWLGLPWALWRGVLPDGSGLHNVMRAARFGSIPERWFSPVIGRDQPRSAWRYRVETMAPLVMARTVGVKIPPPERVGLDQAPVVARWMGEALRRHGACILQAPVSRALRVALAARQLSIDLRGGYFQTVRYFKQYLKYPYHTAE